MGHDHPVYDTSHSECDTLGAHVYSSAEEAESLREGQTWQRIQALHRSFDARE